MAGTHQWRSSRQTRAELLFYVQSSLFLNIISRFPVVQQPDEKSKTINTCPVEHAQLQETVSSYNTFNNLSLLMNERLF